MMIISKQQIKTEAIFILNRDGAQSFESLHLSIMNYAPSFSRAADPRLRIALRELAGEGLLWEQGCIWGCIQIHCDTCGELCPPAALPPHGISYCSRECHQA